MLHKKSDVVGLKSIAVEKHSSLRRDIVSEPILTDHVGRSCGEELEESEKDIVEVHLVILYCSGWRPLQKDNKSLSDILYYKK